MRTPEQLDVGVEGGDLAVARWGDGPLPIVLVHGVTGTSRHFSLLAETLVDVLGEEVTVLAPDLRGRGRSRHLVGPFGMAAHARDCLAVLEALGLSEAVFLGHSMGGFVVAVLALHHPEWVRHALLVDGGVALPVEVGGDDDIDAVLHALIGPAMQRLQMTFASPEEYLAFWRHHPALAASDAWDPWLEDALRYDLWRDGQGWRPTSVLEQIREDFRDTLLDTDTKRAAFDFEVPATFLWCPRGLLDGEPGLYPPEAVSAASQRMAGVAVHQVPDTNHYTVLLSTAGARAVADRVADLI